MLEFPHHMLELALYFKMLLTLCCLLIGETLHHLKCVFAFLHLFHLKIITFQLALPPSSVYCHFPPRWVQPLQIFPTSHVNYAVTWKIKVMYGIQRSGSQHSSTLGLRKQNRRVNLKLAHSACFLKTTRTPSPSTCLLGSLFLESLMLSIELPFSCFPRAVSSDTRTIFWLSSPCSAEKLTSVEMHFLPAACQVHQPEGSVKPGHGQGAGGLGVIPGPGGQGDSGRSFWIHFT